MLEVYPPQQVQSISVCTLGINVNALSPYQQALAQLIYHYIVARKNHTVKLSSIYAKYLHVRPVKYTRSELRTALDSLAKAQVIQIITKHGEILIVATQEASNEQ